MTLAARRCLIATLFALVLSPGLAAAVNLVPNPSFETYSSCPTNLSDLYIAAPWYAPTDGTPDYYNACAPGPPPPTGSYVGVPLNGFGYQQALTGNGYGGMIVQSSGVADYREYLEVPLSSPLAAGATYQVTFNVSLGNICDYAIDRLGAYLAIGSVGPIAGYAALPYTPQVESPAGTFLNDTANWVPITGTFVAMGGEDHLVLGNFHNDATTNTQATGRTYPNCNYYVDDVSVTQVIQVDQACCLPNNQCTVALPSECTAMNGTVQPIGVTCQQQPCGPVAPTPVLWDGVTNVALGSATLDVDALNRRLVASNIGSSGQDGVKLTKADAGRGVAVTWGDYDVDFGTPGCTHTHVLRGTVAGAAVTVAQLKVVTNSDNSETLSPDFTGVHATGMWVELLDALGAIVQRFRTGPTYDIKVAKGAVSALINGLESVGRQRGTRLSARDPHTESAEVRYTGVVVASDAQRSVACSGVRFVRDDGDAVTDIGNAAITASFPQGSPPGTFSIAAEEVVPPCAGLDCPNGPGTGTSLRAFDNAVYATGGSLPERITILPSDATGPMSVSLSPSGCCDGDQQSLAIVTASDATAGTTASLEWSPLGVAGGTATALGHVTGTCQGGVCGLALDFSSVGASGAHVTLRQGGAIVAEATDPTGLQLPLDALSGGGSAVSVEIPGGPGSGSPAAMRIICITSPCPGWPVTMGGATYVADQIDIEPSGSSAGTTIATPDALVSLDVRSTNFPSLQVVGGDLRLSGTLAVPAPAAPAALARPQLSPNPAAGEVHVLFTMAQTGHARVTVIDAAGRAVRSLGEGAFTAGVHSLSWDGLDQAGRRAAPGVYFVRVQSGSTARVSSVTRLR